MLDPSLRSLAQEPNVAAFTTLLPGGQPMTHPVCVHADDDHLLVNTEVARRKYRNIAADPRVALMIIDRANPYHYAEVRGRVTDEVRGERARSQIEELSHKYTGGPYSLPISSERVILLFTPERVRVQG